MGFSRCCTVALMAVTEKQPLGHTCHTAQRELARANVLRNGRLKNNSTLNHGNGNDIGIFQGHDGSKSVNLTVNSNNNNITMYQMGYNSTHSATVTIDGNYATNFFMNQNNGYSSSSYTLNNFCNTSTGCNITVND